MEDDRGDDEYDYEYEDEDYDDDDDDEIPPGMDSGGGASAAPDRGAGGSSSVSADDDLALRDETVIFLDQAQLKVLMSKVVADIRFVAVVCSSEFERMSKFDLVSCSWLHCQSAICFLSA